jgi:peptidoglycan L-alanyl-D-glutamate endopeptidase CwlK
MRKWSNRSLNNLRGIHPDLRRVFDRALQETPNDFAITSGLRTLDEQRAMVESGASQTMNSAHLTGYAVDVAYFDAQGRIIWDWPIYEKNAATIQRIAAEDGVPIQWGGDWPTLRDGPHFELHRDIYDWKAPFSAKPVTVTQRAASAASESKGSIGAGVAASASAVGSIVANAQGASMPIQYALAAVIVLAAGFFLWREVNK